MIVEEGTIIYLPWDSTYVEKFNRAIEERRLRERDRFGLYDHQIVEGRDQFGIGKQGRTLLVLLTLLKQE